MRKQRISIRLNNDQLLLLDELSAGLNTCKSVLVRSIIMDFLTRNEEVLDRIIDEKNGKK